MHSSQSGGRRRMSNPLPKDFPEDAEKQLRLFEMFLKRCSPEEGYVLATLGTAIRLNRVSELWRAIEPLAERMSMPVALFAKMISPGLREKARAAIESLQTLYRERQTNNQPEKEIKNVRTRRTIEKRRSEKNSRRVATKTKRTDQT